MTGGKLSRMSTTEVEELWIALEPAPKYYQVEMKKASDARLAVLLELKSRGLTDKMIGAMVGKTGTQVGVIHRSKKRDKAKQRRAHKHRNFEMEARHAKRELAVLKATQNEAYDPSTYDSPI